MLLREPELKQAYEQYKEAMTGAPKEDIMPFEEWLEEINN